MYVKYSAAMKTARNATTAATLGTSYKIAFYDGTAPASPDAAITTQNKLAEEVGTTTTSNTGGVLTFAAIADGVGLAICAGGKTTTWARISTSGGTAHIDVDCGAPGSGAACIVSPDALIKENQAFATSSFAITAGN